MNCFLLSKLGIVMKAVCVAKTRKLHEFVKCTKSKTVHCYDNGTVFIKNERPLKVLILNKKANIIFLVLVRLKQCALVSQDEFQKC